MKHKRFLFGVNWLKSIRASFQCKSHHFWKVPTVVDRYDPHKKRIGSYKYSPQPITMNIFQCLPRMLSKIRINKMYNKIPSHNIHPKADNTKKCRRAATIVQNTCRIQTSVISVSDRTNELRLVHIKSLSSRRLLQTIGDGSGKLNLVQPVNSLSLYIYMEH